MNMIVRNASDFVKKLTAEKLPGGLLYHSLKHTQEVVDTARIISDKMELSEVQKEKVLLACWFHDTGITRRYLDHEEESIKICAEYLEGINYPLESAREIFEAIAKTHLPSKPVSLIQKVVCDADLSYTGTEDFSSRSELLRQEWFKILGREYTDNEWLENNVRFLSSVKFYTSYAQETFDKQRLKTLNELQTKLEHASRSV